MRRSAGRQPGGPTQTARHMSGQNLVIDGGQTLA